MDTDKLKCYFAANAMRFIRNDGEPHEDMVLIEQTESTADEIEFGFTLKKDRYYVRLKRSDIARMLEQPHD